MYRLIGIILTVALITGALIIVTGNKSSAQYSGLMPEVVVTAPRANSNAVVTTNRNAKGQSVGMISEVAVTTPRPSKSELGMMPEVVVMAEKSKPDKSQKPSSVRTSKPKNSQGPVEYAALDLRTPYRSGRSLSEAVRLPFFIKPMYIHVFGVDFSKGDIKSFGIKGYKIKEDKLAGIKGQQISGDFNLPKSDTLKRDVTVTGGNAAIDGLLKGDLAVMGGAVEINGKVDGDVAVFGGNLNLLGEIKGDAAVFGGNTHNKGSIKGDLFVTGGNVSLDSGSVIEGEISMIGGSVHRDTNAIVHGEIKAVDIGQLNKVLPRIATAFRFPGKFSRFPGRPWLTRAGLFSALFSLSALIVLYILNLLVLLIFPKPIEHLIEKVQSNVWLSVAFGVGIEILFVPLIVLLAVSIIGIPIIPLFILAVFAGMLFGFTAISAIIGERINKGMNWQITNRIGLFSLGWIAIMIIPILGVFLRGVGFIGALLFILGIVIQYVTTTIGLGGIFYALVKRNRQANSQ
jgi:cytoskeletal protein CcmA (bactofilin family)